jgi:hypothetical protein
VKLFINDNPVDIQLQEEKTAFDIIKQLDAWLSEQGHALIGLSIDGAPVELAGQEWRVRPLDGIDIIRIEAPNLHQLRLANLGALNHYAETLNAALVDLSNGKNTLPVILQAIKTYPAVQPALSYLTDNISGDQSSDPVSIETDRLFAACFQADGSFNASVLPALAKQVHALAVLSAGRINEASQPIREAHATAAILGELLPRLGMVSTDLLTNKTKEAFDTILQFSELLSKLLRLFWLMLEVKAPDQPAPWSREELQDWALLVNQCLQQVTEALESQDTVLLGDLLEYELPQHIEKLVGLIPAEE